MGDRPIGAGEHERANLKAFFAGAPVGMFVLDDQLRYVQVNDVLADINGLPAEVHIGKSVPDLFPNLNKTSIPRLKAVLETGEPAIGIEDSGEFPGQPGVKRHWLGSIFRIPGEASGTWALGGVIVDISEHKKAEAVLKDSERRLVQSQRIAHVGSWEWDIVEDVCKCSDEYYRLIGLPEPPARFDYSRFVETVHPEDRAESERRVKQAMAQGEPFESQYRVVHPDGTVLTLHSQVEIDFEDGKALRMRGTVRDITEIERTTAELERESLWRNTALDQLSTGLVMARVSDRAIVYTNPRFDALFGYASGELLGQHASVLNAGPKEEAAERSKAMWTGIQQEGEWHGEVFNVRKDGSEFWTQAGITVVLDPEYGEVVLATNEDITESKRAEEALLQGEADLQSMIEGNPDGIVVVADGRIVACNSAYVRLARIPKGRILGREPSDFMHPDDVVLYDPRMKILLSGETPSPVEFRFVADDGSEVPVEARSAPIVFHGRSAVFGTVRDITKRKQQEELLRDGERGLRESQRIANVGSWEWDIARNVSNCSDEYFRLIGLQERPESFTYEMFMDLVHPADRAELARKVEERMGRREPFDNQYRIVRPDGVARTFHGRGEVDFEDDKPVRMRGTIQDITDRLEVEAAAKSSEHRLRTILDATADALITIDEEGVILECNRAAEELFGYSMEEAHGQPISKLMSEPDASRHPSYLQKYTETGVRAVIGTSREVEAVNKDGELIPIRLRVREAEYEGRAVFIGTIQDLREQKELEAQLMQGQKMEAIGSLAGGVAHDFNNLLTVIGGHTEMLLEELESPQLRSNVEQIGKAADYAASLTHQLLAFSRKQVLEPKVLDLGGITSDLEMMVRRLIPENIQLTTNIGPQLGLVRVDPTQVKQVILNLVVNARDAMPTGGTLTIDVLNAELTEGFVSENIGAVAGPHVLMRIHDTGTGMNPETQSRIFEPFYTTKEETRGTGLGLAMGYGIVKQSGGYIRILSREGEGTTFEIYFPHGVGRREDTLDDGTEGPLEGEVTSCRILLAEDDAGVRRVTSSLLVRGGHDILEAENGADAIQIHKDLTEPLDLLITDVVMPDMSGPELAEQLRVLQPNLKVLFVSGYMDDALKEHLAAFKDTPIIFKPFKLAELSAKVTEILTS